MEEWTRIRLRRGVVQKFPCHNCRVGGVQKHSDVDMEKVPDYGISRVIVHGRSEGSPMWSSCYFASDGSRG